MEDICTSHQLNEAKCVPIFFFFFWMILTYFNLFSPPCSYTSSSLVGSSPVTRGTGRTVTKAATASPTKSGANPTLTPEISRAHTLSPPQLPVPAPFPLQLLLVPPAVPLWARRGHPRRVAPSGALVDQVPVYLMICLHVLHIMHLIGVLYNDPVTS